MSKDRGRDISDLMKDYPAQVRKVINNPDKSRTELYKEIKGTDLGMRKQDFLKLARHVRQEPKQVEHVPKKYRTPQDDAQIVSETPARKYKQQKVIHGPSGDERWLRYANRKERRRILQQLMKGYGYEFGDLQFGPVQDKKYEAWDEGIGG